MDFKILLLIFIILVILDKGITAWNIIEVNKHFPEATKGDYYKVEVNPVAKVFFEKFYYHCVLLIFLLQSSL